MKIDLAGEQPFKQMTRQMNKLLDQLQKGYSNFLPSETWTPNVNLYETENAYLVCVDLAGVDKEKIDLTLTDNMLQLRGSRVVPAPQEAQTSEGQHQRVRVHLMEIDHGAFVREVELPQGVEHERISANYRNGMLWIEVPKK
jgi:HSP20 family protein